MVKSVKKKSSRAVKKVVTKADFNSLLRNGLSSVKSYIVLKQKSRSPVYLAFKPILTRINAVAIYIGGKLSAFPKSEMENPIETMQKAWKNLPPDRVSSQRIGSHAGLFLSAGQADLKKLLAKAELKPMIKKLLDGIEEKLGIEIENRLDVTKFLMMVYAEQLESAFYENGSSLPPRQIGKLSDVAFGQNASYANGDNKVLAEFINDHHLEAKNKQLQAA